MVVLENIPENAQLTFEPYLLKFKQASGTSRGVLTDKKGWIVRISDGQKVGIGECSIIPGLSPDYTDSHRYQKLLNTISEEPLKYLNNTELLKEYPSVLFGLESAFLDLKNGGKQLYFESDFTNKNTGIPINGLVWMGDEDFMSKQIDEKISSGYSCIKMKVGAIDFATELHLLKKIRERFSSKDLTLRVDANGAFSLNDVRNKLEELAKLDIHSIEQPIKQGQWHEMSDLCRENIIPIALDEELIGVYNTDEKIKLLETIKPPYIILKPSLHGGISGVQEWIHLAEDRNINWWITSALESNIGLNSIAQLTGTYKVSMPQGLGTGGLYTTNFDSPLYIEDGNLFYSP